MTYFAPLLASAMLSGRAVAVTNEKHLFTLYVHREQYHVC